MADWRKPRYAEFEDRNFWSLYNCFTQGLKRIPAGEIMDRYAVVHDFFKTQIADMPEVELAKAIADFEGEFNKPI